MNKDLAKGLVTFAAGFLAGFVVAKCLSFEKNDEEEPEKFPEPSTLKEKEPEKPYIEVDAAKIASKDHKGVNYTKFWKLKHDEEVKAESDYPKEDDDKENYPTDEDLEDECMETEDEMNARHNEEFHERFEQYEKEHGSEIKPITWDEFDSDFPEVDYPHKTLYYYIPDDGSDPILTDEDNNVITDIQSYLGSKFLTLGFGKDEDDDLICIRNNPMETDFKVEKRSGTPDEY